MAITFQGSVGISVRANMSSTPVLSTPSDDLVQSWSNALAHGTAANQAIQHWSDSRSLAATSETLDVAGSLVNGLGNTVTFATVRVMIIRNKATTAGFDLLVGGAASNQMAGFVSDAASDKIVVRAGGTLVLIAPLDGYTVTAGTGDKLKIDAGANTVPYDIILIGT